MHKQAGTLGGGHQPAVFQTSRQGTLVPTTFFSPLKLASHQFQPTFKERGVRLPS